MKTLLSLLLLVVPLSLRAANPSFGSFSTNDFDVQQPYIYLAHSQTGGTNIFINTTNIYVDSSVYYTNVTFSVTNSYISITNTTFVINGTNAAAINPTIGRIPYNANGSNFLDSALFHIDPTTAGVDNLNAGVVGVSNLVTGGLVASVLDVDVGVLTNVPAGTGFLHNDGANTFSYLSVADVCLWTNLSSYLQPVDLTQPLFWTNAVSFNAAHTTALYSDGSNLFLTNSTATPLLKVVDASGNTAAYGVESPGYAFIRADSGKVVALNVTGSPDLWYTGSALYPASGVVDIGSTSAHVFRHAYLNGTISDYGFISGTNTAWLDINHGGTNSSTGGPVFNSRSQGIAGTGQPISFRVDSTNLFKIDYTVGASTTGLLIYENGTAQRVTIGANDSGGAGFRVLRIPN